MKQSLTGRILREVMRESHQTAWSIAKQVHAPSASVSSILKKKADQRLLKRSMNWRNTWVYWA